MNTPYLDKLFIEDCNDFMKKLEPKKKNFGKLRGAVVRK